MAGRPLRHHLLGNATARTARSAYSWLVLGIIVIVWVPLVFLVWMATAPLDKGRYWPGFVFRRLCVLHQWLNPMWTFRTSGVEIDNPRNPYVVVSNHESFVDMLLISHLPWEMKGLSKESMFKIPLVGWLMIMADAVKIIRGDKQSTMSAMRGCGDRLGRNVNVMLFSEGSRTRDGSLGEFKDGSFRLAVDRQVPMLPLVVNGAREALQAESWRMNVTDTEVRVLAPIPTAGITRDAVAALHDRVRGLIASEVAVMRSEGRSVQAAAVKPPAR